MYIYIYILVWRSLNWWIIFVLIKQFVESEVLITFKAFSNPDIFISTQNLSHNLLICLSTVSCVGSQCPCGFSFGFSQQYVTIKSWCEIEIVTSCKINCCAVLIADVNNSQVTVRNCTLTFSLFILKCIDEYVIYACLTLMVHCCIGFMKIWDNSQQFDETKADIM